MQSKNIKSGVRRMGIIQSGLLIDLKEMSWYLTKCNTCGETEWIYYMEFGLQCFRCGGVDINDWR